MDRIHTRLPASHLQVIIRELEENGGRTTYLDLEAKYVACGYTLNGFRAAVSKLRKAGIVAPLRPGAGRGALIAAGNCPCCGRALGG